MMTENQVFVAFCDALDEAKEKMGVPTEWAVLARNPQNMAHLDEVILVDKISQRRRGFQNERYESGEDGQLHLVWEWIEEYRYQVSVMRERRLNDAPTTITADEVACLLRAWVNSSEGAYRLRERSLAPLFVFDVQNQQYQDENDVYQYFPHFDVMIEVVQVKHFEQPHVSAIDLGIKHIPLCQNESAGEVDYKRIWEEKESSH